MTAWGSEDHPPGIRTLSGGRANGRQANLQAGAHGVETPERQGLGGKLNVQSDGAAKGPAGHPTLTGASLVALLAVASVANLNLAVANIAVPDIGAAFHASQTEMNLVSVGFSVGLASSVLYLGAIGDRHGRKGLLALGMIVTVPTALLAAWAPNIVVLIAARVLGGVAAGMAYPTTLALITALSDGPRRTRAIALWSAVGGSIVVIATLVAGWLLDHYWWGSVFLISAPLAILALAVAWFTLPAHVGETTDPVDHPGGVLSVVAILALVLAINLAPSPGEGTIVLVAGAVALLGLAAFYRQERRARHPLFDLHYGGRPTFWVAATAGMIVFGTLLGGFYIGTQFVQLVLGYSTLKAGTVGIPAAVVMLLVAPLSARVIARFGSRVALLLGYGFLLLSFLTMLLLWTASASFFEVSLAFALMGAGVALAGTPASHSLTGSVPVSKVGMASGTADLQRDLGGSIMQSILGVILTAAYAADVARRLATTAYKNDQQVTTVLERSFASAADYAQKTDPSQAKQIIAGARASFLSGADWAYTAGAIAIVLGAILVATMFPSRDEERALIEGYAAADAPSASSLRNTSAGS